MNDLLRMCFIACPLVFVAGFVDAIAGGGGLITLPAYLLAGLPAHYALGTNKMATSIGTFTAASKYIKEKQVNLKVAAITAVGAIFGAFIGTNLTLILSDKLLKTLMLIILPAVAVFLLVKRDFGKNINGPKQMSTRRLVVTASLIGMTIGCYDGLIGPGTGTFLMLAFTAFMGFDLLKSSGCAKVANLASNLASMVVFIINGKVFFALAVPAAVCSVLGNYAGARLAIKGGSKYVRYATFFVIGLLFVKMSMDLFSK